MPDAKAWTVLVWMAGDNDLEQYAKADLAEMKKVASTDAVNVIAQVDTMRDDKTRRYVLRPGTSIDADVVDDLGATNTGDPRVAIDFFTWGIKRYPARHYLAVLWNHGSGIDETDVYRAAAQHGVQVQHRAPVRSSAAPRSRVRAILSSRHRRALFSTTIATAVGVRGIAYDDTARDFLDNAELKRVLAQVATATGRKIDVLGFDACLMNMIEVAYQLKTSASFIVGSEETEPGDGWPYDTVLAALATSPSMTPRQLGAAVVQRYAASYAHDDVTLSVLDVSRVDAAARAVDALGASLETAIRKPVEYAAVTKAIQATQHYELDDFLDLQDLCTQILARTKSAAVKKAAQATIASLQDAPGLVAAEKHKGRTVTRSHGITIYFPRGDVTVAYDKLDFARATRWGRFIRAYTGR
jgi:hypothetical protein